MFNLHRTRGKLGHDPIQWIRLGKLKPSPENSDLYRPVDPHDPDIAALSESIVEFGVREPLAVTLDGYIISGHRRYAAARNAGLLFVPCYVEDFGRVDDPDRFARLLRQHNGHEVKKRGRVALRDIAAEGEAG